jgi:ubiquinone/menaquinone biosynthesis C-methylase UbiE
MGEPDISIYDKYDYDYTSYWKERSYEHEAEKLVLDRILSGITGDWCIDIGGSFGRHVPQYHQRFHNCVIADYSIKALVQARKELKKRGIDNVHLVAANAYNLPFAGNVFDTALMVRVMHHLEEPSEVIDEIRRILKPDALLILEFANKIHLKSLLKSLLTLRWTYPFSTDPIDVSSQYSEGTVKQESGIMKNYHPGHVKNLIVSQETALRRFFAVSFLRVPLLKRILPHSLLIRLEAILQRVFGRVPLTPSVIAEAYSTKEIADGISPHTPSFDEILVCPKCKGPLSRRGGAFSCPACRLSFRRTSGILDLRYPLITE